jgi:RimJ/RimL family protein N-acetyltransferase
MELLLVIKGGIKMSIKNTIQPEIIDIEEKLRIRKPAEDEWGAAVEWYHNPKVMYYSEGVTNKVYELYNIQCMYKILGDQGEVYFIEAYENNSWKPIGDASLSEKNLPIVIGDEAYWGKGIGGKVVSKLIERAKEIGLRKITVEIYKYNDRSRNLFTSHGFIKVSEDEECDCFELNLCNK